jgi:hypothetical protein
MEKKSGLGKWLKIAVFFMTVASIVMVSYELKWLDVLLGICKLEKGNKSVQSISLKTLAFISYSNHEVEFLMEMQARGWNFVKHYGRGMIFDKDGYEILITKHEYFGRYAFYEVTTREIFNLI